jgi:hypothetical protein
MEYEFTTVFDIAMDHNAVASKDRTGLFDGQIFKISKDTGAKIMKWLKAGKAAAAPVPQTKAAAPKPCPAPAGEGEFPADEAAGPKPLLQIEQFAKAKAALAKLGINEEKLWEGVHMFTAKNYQVAHTDLGDFTPDQSDGIVAYLNAWEKNIVDKRAAKAAKEQAHA